MSKKRALGKDLSVLLGDLGEGEDVSTVEGINDIEVQRISRAAYQSRKIFTEDKIEALAASIRSSGLLQPVIVRPKAGTTDQYELVAGERRWRAANLAGLEKIPCIVRQMDDKQAAVLGLLENVQRQDLGVYEQALALKELMTKHSYTQQALSDKLGMSRPSLANLLRLLNLEPAALNLLRQGLLEAGHAKALLALPLQQQAKAAQMTVDKKLNVRQVERLVDALSSKKGKVSQGKGLKEDADIRALAEELSDQLGLAVNFAHRKDGGGKMTINYGNLDELDRLFKALGIRK